MITKICAAYVLAALAGDYCATQAGLPPGVVFWLAFSLAPIAAAVALLFAGRRPVYVSARANKTPASLPAGRGNLGSTAGC